jgi:hypothetical protein|tara:strand:+ start:969 stop:1148 length:180 start_codon:yes stop_codon:yes gene_type:complete
MFDVIIEMSNGETRVAGSYMLFVEAEQHRMDTEQYTQSNPSTQVSRVYILEKTRKCDEG